MALLAEMLGWFGTLLVLAAYLGLLAGRPSSGWLFQGPTLLLGRPDDQQLLLRRLA